MEKRARAPNPNRETHLRRLAEPRLAAARPQLLADRQQLAPVRVKLEHLVAPHVGDPDVAVAV